jgi:hypothetical protein
MQPAARSPQVPDGRQQPTAHCPLPTAHCRLPTAHCPFTHQPPPPKHTHTCHSPTHTHTHTRPHTATSMEPAPHDMCAYPPAHPPITDCVREVRWQHVARRDGEQPLVDVNEEGLVRVKLELLHRQRGPRQRGWLDPPSSQSVEQL